MNTPTPSSWNFVSADLLEATKGILDSFILEVLEFAQRAKTVAPHYAQQWQAYVVHLEACQPNNTSKAFEHAPYTQVFEKALERFEIELLHAYGDSEALTFLMGREREGLEIRLEGLAFLFRKWIEIQTYLEPTHQVEDACRRFRQWQVQWLYYRQVWQLEAIKAQRCLAFYHAFHKNWNEAFDALEVLMAPWLMTDGGTLLTLDDESQQALAYELRLVILPLVEGLATAKEVTRLSRLEGEFDLVERLCLAPLSHYPALLEAQQAIWLGLIEACAPQSMLSSKAQEALGKIIDSMERHEPDLRAARMLVQGCLAMVPSYGGSDQDWDMCWEHAEHAMTLCQLWLHDKELCEWTLELLAAILNAKSVHYLKPKQAERILEQALAYGIQHRRSVDVQASLLNVLAAVTEPLLDMEQCVLLVQLADYFLIQARMGITMGARHRQVYMLILASLYRLLHTSDFAHDLTPLADILRPMMDELQELLIDNNALGALEVLNSHTLPNLSASGQNLNALSKNQIFQERLWSHRFVNQANWNPRHTLYQRLETLFQLEGHTVEVRRAWGHCIKTSLLAVKEGLIPAEPVSWKRLYHTWLEASDDRVLAELICDIASNDTERQSAATLEGYMEPVLSILTCHPDSVTAWRALAVLVQSWFALVDLNQSEPLPMLVTLEDQLQALKGKVPSYCEDKLTGILMICHYASMQALVDTNRLEEARAVLVQMRFNWLRFPDSELLTDCLGKGALSMVLALSRQKGKASRLADWPEINYLQEMTRQTPGNLEILFFYAQALVYQQFHAFACGNAPKVKELSKQLETLSLPVLKKRQSAEPLLSEAFAELLGFSWAIRLQEALQRPGSQSPEKVLADMFAAGCDETAGWPAMGISLSVALGPYIQACHNNPLDDAQNKKRRQYARKLYHKVYRLLTILTCLSPAEDMTVAILSKALTLLDCHWLLGGQQPPPKPFGQWDTRLLGWTVGHTAPYLKSILKQRHLLITSVASTLEAMPASCKEQPSHRLLLLVDQLSQGSVRGLAPAFECYAKAWLLTNPEALLEEPVFREGPSFFEADQPHTSANVGILAHMEEPYALEMGSPLAPRIYELLSNRWRLLQAESNQHTAQAKRATSRRSR